MTKDNKTLEEIRAEILREADEIEANVQSDMDWVVDAVMSGNVGRDRLYFMLRSIVCDSKAVGAKRQIVYRDRDEEL